ncbi:ubiquitin thioesterase OTU1-like [Penaeus japonicus]|uniref:ubiquitin thioesterase OTU1-like n=1 Tax=Penaeus japonicus TaxID=27405 RepID=UPI001C70C4CE|nr:ubiquitin thioesterase OTU1-like [Penaeus japonicus]XP_042877566.1 ubiquitin thioesterase OTU1-like [Penaeus japonicus]
MMLRLRLKTKGGGQFPLTERVSGDSTIEELRSAIFEVTAICPERQKILSGYPPKPVLGHRDMSLSSAGIRNGEVLIVEDVEPSINATSIPSGAPASDPRPVLKEAQSAPRPAAPPATKVPTSQSLTQKGILLKKVVPSDNSCLFASIYYLVNGGGEIDTKELHAMRQVVATVIHSQPDVYSEALLEKSNNDYCKWILKETSWGGAIELSVFSNYYEIEIVALDAKTGVLNRFGEDKRFDHRMIVMYDGIHYDPVYMETFEGGTLTIFPTTDDSVLAQAKDIAMEAKHSGQFTDTNAFRLECKQCGTLITGEDQALAHAKKTGHSKFDEVRNN